MYHDTSLLSDSDKNRTLLRKIHTEKGGGHMAGRKSQEASELFNELTNYERKGIEITLNGFAASPMQVVQAHIMREDAVFMRDYVLNDHGDIEELCFTNIEVSL